jgi:hypothetical protein
MVNVGSSAPAAPSRIALTLSVNILLKSSALIAELAEGHPRLSRWSIYLHSRRGEARSASIVVRQKERDSERTLSRMGKNRSGLTGSICCWDEPGISAPDNFSRLITPISCSYGYYAKSVTYKRGNGVNILEWITQ